METAPTSVQTDDYLRRIVIKKANTYHIIKITDVQWIEASGNYINVITDTDKHLFRSTLTGIGKKLDPVNFVQIHRSTIVNIEYIRKIEESAYGDCIVMMKNGEKLKMSRNYKDLLQNF